MRALPEASTRALPDGQVYFVDAQAEAIRHRDRKIDRGRPSLTALGRLQPGDTLCLRGGVYYQPCVISIKGTADQPITMCGYPGELAVIDAGLPDFHESPETAWQPVGDGADGEYVSSRAYPGLEKVFGNFADSMVPLHGYRNLIDLRSDNEYWGGGNKLDTDWSIYCGPGVWYDQASGRIHCRLAHTRLAALGPDNYRGQTDPRRLRLIVTAAPDAVHVQLSQHVRLQDLVLRGARRSALHVAHSQHIEVDNVTCYGSDPVVNLRGCRSVRLHPLQRSEASRHPGRFAPA